jgi:hypothetical protein
MRIQVIISRKEFIPDTARKTGISEEELTRRFEAAEAGHHTCSFNIDVPTELFQDDVCTCGEPKGLHYEDCPLYPEWMRRETGEQDQR